MKKVIAITGFVGMGKQSIDKKVLSLAIEGSRKKKVEREVKEDHAKCKEE